MFNQFEGEEHLMTDESVITPVVKRILQSMKQGEIVSTVVAPEYVEKTDAEFKTRHQDFKPDENLLVDVNLKGLCAI